MRNIRTPLTLGIVSLTLVVAACHGGNKSADQAAAPPPSETPAATSQQEAPTAAPAPAPVPPPQAESKPAPSRPASKPAPSQPPPAPVAATPKPEPSPAPVITTLATGTEIDAELVDPASSKTSAVGDVVRARVTKDVSGDGRVVIPAGSLIDGTVTEAVPLKTIGGAASLGLRFDTLDVAGTKIPLSATLHQKGKSETAKDAGTIAGAAAGGAILGRILTKHDKTKGTIIGAAVGAAAGTGAAAATKGQEVELPAGTPFVVKLDQPIQISAPR